MKINKTEDDNFLLVTYPRTGSHFLHHYLKQLTNFSLNKTHNPAWDGDKKIITIIRDPEESLRSAFTMSKHYAIKNNPNFDWELNKHDHQLTNPTSYFYFFEYMINNSDVIIDYKTLIDHPYSVCKFLAEYIGLEIKPEQPYVQFLKDDQHEKYLVSSTSSSEYEEMDVSWVDMSRHYKIYKEVLARKTM
jgi:hypothetical protein